MNNIAVKRFVVQDFQSSEAIKTLRTNIIFSGNSIKAVALTSFSASEGKSSLCFQLAASMALAGKRVLLLDTDLRKSVLQSRLRVRERVDGLSHYLSGLANVNELIRETDIPGLYIIFAGALVPNSAELLGGESFDKLIPALKEVFDYIIVDAAPLGQVVDCAVMAPKLDGVVVVVDTTHNSYKLERRILDQLKRSGGKVLGVVLNRVDFKDRHSYYGKAYGYGDYSGYGETEKADQEK